jgi:hypothetical protein
MGVTRRRSTTPRLLAIVAIAGATLVASSAWAAGSTAHPRSNASLRAGGYVANITAARHALEGLGALKVNTARLATLSVPQQLFALISLERLSRGLGPEDAMTSTLDGYAQSAATRSRPPTIGFANLFAHVGGASAALAADFTWMYQGGPAPYGAGTPSWAHSATCAKSARGCWAQRDAILSTRPEHLSPPGVPVMGVGWYAKAGALSAAFASNSIVTPVWSGTVRYTWVQAIAALGLSPSVAGEMPATLSQIPLGAYEPLHVAASTSGAWVTTGKQVFDVSTVSGQVVATIPDNGASGVAVDAAHAWVVDTAGVTEIDATSGQVVAHIADPGASAICDDGMHVWVTDPQGVTEINAVTGAVMAVIAVPNAVAVSSDGVHVWVTNGLALTEINANTDQVIATILDAGAGALSADGVHVWVADAKGVNEYDPLTGLVVKSIAIPGAYVVTSDGAHVWIVTARGSVSPIQEYVISSGTFAHAASDPANPYRSRFSVVGDVAAAGPYLWAVDAATDSLLRLRAP